MRRELMDDKLDKMSIKKMQICEISDYNALQLTSEVTQ